MKKSILPVVAIVVVSMFAFVLSAAAEEKVADKPKETSGRQSMMNRAAQMNYGSEKGMKEKEHFLFRSVKGEVLAVDAEKKTITIMGKRGEERVAVGDPVRFFPKDKTFADIKPGVSLVVRCKGKDDSWTGYEIKFVEKQEEKKEEKKEEAAGTAAKAPDKAPGKAPEKAPEKPSEKK